MVRVRVTYSVLDTVGVLERLKKVIRSVEGRLPVSRMILSETTDRQRQAEETYDDENRVEECPNGTVYKPDDNKTPSRLLLTRRALCGW
jgi:hypothetical protein